jgi:hypothetical protein
MIAHIQPLRRAFVPQAPIWRRMTLTLTELLIQREKNVKASFSSRTPTDV